MLHLALAALLAGSLGIGAIDAPTDGDKDKTPRTEAMVGVTVAEEDAPVHRSYAFGRAEPTFLRVWAGYGWGQDDQWYRPDGTEADLTERQRAEITAQRAFIGAQVNVFALQNLQFGIGGELALASRSEDRVVDQAGTVQTFDSGFGLQQARVYGELRGRVLGLHAGYIFDLGDEPAADEAPVSDGSDAFFIGASFDYPAQWLRLFGGIDYYSFLDTDQIAAPGFPEWDGDGWDRPALLAFHFGAGVNISWVEIGAAAILRTNTVYSRFGIPGSGHNGSIAPYINISPPALPVALSIRGAFTDEYVDYGYSLGGARDLVTHRGFMAALSWGF